ncbi:unnamed protein product [Caenorhabditis sp. 36 PRJEB53466]|nr:unnamed protein product [Caenorhabditis sp. 36 PRJEB53466]
MIPRSSTSRWFSNNARKSQKKVDCAVYGCGLSASGALAIPKLVQSASGPDGEMGSKETERPKRIPFFNTFGVRHVASGFGFSLFASDTKLWGAGINNRLQIGGHLSSPSQPVQDYYISAKKINIPCGRIVGISSGRAHSLILTDVGVFCIGDNNFGQCGRDPQEFPRVVGVPEHPLQPILTEFPIKSVHCSLDTSFLLDSEGTVWSFGLNEDGQCANGRYGIEWTPQKVGGDLEGVRVKEVSGSTDTLLAVSEQGELFVWGQTEYGQACGASDLIQLNTARSLSISSSIGPISSAATTQSSVIVGNVRGEVYVWGVGVLGMGPDVDRLKAPTLMDQPLFDGKKVVSVFAGNSCMSALNCSERLFVWGENRFSSLGLGHSKRQLFPYQLFLPGDVKTAALGPDHSLFLV